VAGWLRTWVATLPQRVRSSTATSYTAHVNNVLIPALGHRPLGALTRGHVQDMIDDLAERTNRYQAKITPATVHRIRATLRRALNAAITRDLLTDNQARLIELPSPRRNRPLAWSEPRVAAWRRDGTRPRIAVWTPAQLAVFLTAVADDDLFELWWLAGPRGLRRVELVGLRWIDIDLADASLTVAQTLVEIPGPSPAPNRRPPRATGRSSWIRPPSRSSPTTGAASRPCTPSAEPSPASTGLCSHGPTVIRCGRAG